MTIVEKGGDVVAVCWGVTYQGQEICTMPQTVTLLAITVPIFLAIGLGFLTSWLTNQKS